MTVLKKVALFCLALFLVNNVVAQAKLGEWRSHLYYRRALKAVQANDRIYCGTENGVYYVSLKDNSVTMLSKVDGLSGVNVVTIDVDKATQNVFIAYEGGLVDMLGPDYVVPIPYIAEATSILGNKTVNNFFFSNGLAYMATNFGIVVYDIDKREIRETYLNLDERGNQLEINDVAVYNGRVYASSKMGLRSGNINDNLLDFNFWRTDLKMDCDVMEVFNNQLLLHLSDNRVQSYDGQVFADFAPMAWAVVRHMDVYQSKLVVTKKNNILYFDTNYRADSLVTGSPSHGLLDSKGAVWLSNWNNGLIKFDPDPIFYTPNGPGGATAWDFAYANGELWVASGGVDLAFNPRFLNNGVYMYDNQHWTNFNGSKNPSLTPLRDLHQVRIDAQRGIKYVASYNKGLAVFDANNQITVYDQNNSDGAISTRDNDTGSNAWISMAGIDLDTQGNLWMTMQYTEQQLAVRTAEGKWQSFNIGSEKRVNDVLVDASGQKWVIIHLNGIYVFNDGGTPLNTSDDKVRFVNQSLGNGNLPAPDVYSMAIDKDGDLWLGTGDGVAVIYSPENVFKGQPFDATRPTIQDGEAVGYLLQAQKVNCIKVDGANQKWFGTDKGVFVTNPTGDKIVYEFNTSNSPILSDVVRSIGINEKTGEVFFATDLGISSYRAVATEGDKEQKNVYVYPNPVRPGYSGPIAITGLVANANVKITDISGNLVYETTAQGGTATWNGKTLNGQAVASGVYLALSSDSEGKTTHISKIMIIR